MSDASVTLTDQRCTPATRAPTTADTIPTADATITPVTVRTGTIRLTVSVIVSPRSAIPHRRVLTSVDIIVARQRRKLAPTKRSRNVLLLREPAITTVSTVRGSLSMIAIATGIVRRLTAGPHARTLAVSTATFMMAGNTGLRTTEDIQEDITVCIIPLTVLGK